MTVDTFTNEKIHIATDQTYSVEYFHVYTDDDISSVHTGSLGQMRTIALTLGKNARPIILIDNYNPTEDKLSSENIFQFLDSQGASPEYWAYESDLVENAKVLLGNMTDSHLERSYRRYIEKHDKFPCSLLTAAWYLTRLGVLDAKGVIRTVKNDTHEFVPSEALINILPGVYNQVERRAYSIIAASKYANVASKIYYVFYETEDFIKPNAY